MTAGRPSKYDPAFCEQIVEFCAEGYSLTSFAAEIDVARSRINDWAEQHEEFREAVSRAKNARARWWEDKARAVAESGGPGGQATMVIFGLKNHAPEDYQDISRKEVTGKDGGPLEHRIDSPTKETREEWLARQQMGTATGAATGGNPGDVVR